MITNALINVTVDCGTSGLGSGRDPFPSVTLNCDKVSVMPSIHLTTSEVTFLHSLLDDVVSRHCWGLDNQLFESTLEDVQALSEKVERLHIDNPADRTCIVCGAVITSPNPRKVTCSDACRQAWSRMLRKEKAKVAPREAVRK